MLLILGIVLLSISGGAVGQWRPWWSRGCNGDPNAEYVDCASMCPPTCEEPYGTDACASGCAEISCACKEGFIQDVDTGLCIRREDCPNGCNGDPNAEKVDCASWCPPTCDDPYPTGLCPAACAPVSCACKEGYILRPRGRVPGSVCVKEEECPNQCEDPNAVPKPCPSACQPTCMDRRPPESRPCTRNCLPSGCVCRPGFILDRKGGVCIEKKRCPLGGYSCDGDHNATRVSCGSACPRTCGDDNDRACILSCVVDACVCKRGYVLSNDGAGCIKPEDCPQCLISNRCKRTCANPNPRSCPFNSPGSNVNGCECMEGYLLSDTHGKCINIYECPSGIGCNGDPNAIVSDCPDPNPSTCAAPRDLPRTEICAPIGCECNTGYILNDKTGLCVLPTQCPGGNPCRRNEHFENCSEICPPEYCPRDDFRGIYLCDGPGRDHCRSGCVCDWNYRRLSVKDPRCIPAYRCPPVKCTRINEIFSRCSTEALREDCIDLFETRPNYGYEYECQPRCVCKPGHYRNGSDLCVPAHECPLPRNFWPPPVIELDDYSARR
nr:zonadhesin-like protein 2 [Pseudoips prasinana]